MKKAVIINVVKQGFNPDLRKWAQDNFYASDVGEQDCNSQFYVGALLVKI